MLTQKAKDLIRENMDRVNKEQRETVEAIGTMTPFLEKIENIRDGLKYDTRVTMWATDCGWIDVSVRLSPQQSFKSLSPLLAAVNKIDGLVFVKTHMPDDKRYRSWKWEIEGSELCLRVQVTAYVPTLQEGESVKGTRCIRVLKEIKRRKVIVEEPVYDFVCADAKGRDVPQVEEKS